MSPTASVELARLSFASNYESGTTWKDGFGLARDDGQHLGPPEPTRGYLVSHMAIGYVLGPKSCCPGITSATLVDVGDVSALRARRVEYVVLHWNLLREFFNMIERKHQGPAAMRYVERLRDHLRAILGPPHGRRRRAYRMRVRP